MKIFRRLGLISRFNFLTIALILATSVGITVFVVREQTSGAYGDLVNRGISISTIIAQNSEYCIYTEDRKCLEQMADSVLSDLNITYVAFLNSGKGIIVQKSKKSIGAPKGMEMKAVDSSGRTLSGSFVSPDDRRRYTEILTTVMSVAAGGLAGLGQEPSTGPTAIGYVRVGLTPEGIQARIRKFFLSTVLFTLILVAIGVGATIMMTRRITSPVKRLVQVARAISEGRLDHRIEEQGGDEIGALASAINVMAANLRDMIFKLNRLAGAVSGVTADMTDSPASVLGAVDRQSKAIEETVLTISAIKTSISSIADIAEGLYRSAERAREASGEMNTSATNVAENAKVFSRTSQDSAASVEEMIAAVSEIARSLNVISSSAEDASAALFEMNTTTGEIQQHAEESVRQAEQVTLVATERGTAVVNRAVAGIQNVMQQMTAIAEAAARLEGRSEEIGAIVTVIDDVADQTGLLALNAAILAAQAGEHGGAFSIVADEIKKLAEKTAASTGEITELIASIQADTRESVAMTGNGARSVQDAIRLTEAVSQMLQTILDRARTSTDMARAIERATVENGKVVGGITSLVRKQVEEIEHISRATTEQSKGGRLIGDAMNTVKHSSLQVMNATRDQLAASRQVATISEDVSSRAVQITSALKNQEQKSGEIVDFVQNIRSTTENLRGSAERMNDRITSLRKDAEALLKELQRFQV